MQELIPWKKNHVCHIHQCESNFSSHSLLFFFEKQQQQNVQPSLFMNDDLMDLRMRVKLLTDMRIISSTFDIMHCIFWLSSSSSRFAPHYKSQILLLFLYFFSVYVTAKALSCHVCVEMTALKQEEAPAAFFSREIENIFLQSR